MSHISVKNERVIPAPPEQVYEVLRDYKEKRPRMLTPNFIDYVVEKGGVGSGTVMRYLLHAAGRERPYRMKVQEPVKGRVITERDSNSSLVTTWTLDPFNGGDQTKVSVATEWDGKDGMSGLFERAFAPIGLRRMYGSMLAVLATLARGKEVQGEEGASSRLALALGTFSSIMAVAAVIGYLRKQEQ